MCVCVCVCVRACVCVCCVLCVVLCCVRMVWCCVVKETSLEKKKPLCRLPQAANENVNGNVEEF